MGIEFVPAKGNAVLFVVVIDQGFGVAHGSGRYCQ